MSYTVIGNTKSRAFRVLWCLEEMSQPYSQINAAPRSDQVRTFNPSGKIPVLLDGDQVLTDSVAIMTFLADRHEYLTSTAGTHARADQDATMNFLMDEFDALLWTISKHEYVLPPERRISGLKDALAIEFAQSCERLAGRIIGPFIMGENFTIVDIMATHCLNWANSSGLIVEDTILLEYAKGMRNRPAYQRSVSPD